MRLCGTAPKAGGRPPSRDPLSQAGFTRRPPSAEAWQRACHVARGRQQDDVLIDLRGSVLDTTSGEEVSHAVTALLTSGVCNGATRASNPIGGVRGEYKSTPTRTRAGSPVLSSDAPKPRSRVRRRMKWDALSSRSSQVSR